MTESVSVTGQPRRGCPTTTAELSMRPARTSLRVVVYVPVQIIHLRGASVVRGQVIRPSRLSVSVTWYSGTWPVLVTRYL